MKPAKRLLFICSHNLQRSITAEKMFEGVEGYEVTSAGTLPQARVRVSEEHVNWAEMIFVMEHKHVEWLRENFKKELAGKRLICLEIQDRYGYMNSELLKLLRKRLSAYLDLPKSMY
jgi:predicted protein tyrosine phosphatase